MITWGGPGTARVAARTDTNGDESVERGIFATISDQLGPPIRSEHEHPGSVQRTRAGTAKRLVVPGTTVTVEDCEHGTTHPLAAPTELPDGAYLVTCQSSGRRAGAADPATVYVRFDGPASIEPNDDTVGISFWDRTAVTVGHGATDRVRTARVTVEPTVESVARGVTHLAAAHRTTGPARTHPAFRDRPPLLTVGTETTVPRRVRESKAETDLTLTVPDCMGTLFVAAPLAYYLGARVEVGDCAEPTLAGASGFTYDFDPLPAFQHQCAQLLRRVFYLDCQVRRVASCGDGCKLGRNFDLDPEAVQNRPMCDRLQRYLEVPRDVVDRMVPEWHLSTYVAPTEQHVPAISHLVDRMSLVYLPQAHIVDKQELLNTALAQAYPTRGTPRPTDGVVKAVRQTGRAHAWLAPGTPINAFELTPESLENQATSVSGERERMRVVVVLNDDEMAAEQTDVAGVYENCAANLPMDVTVRRRLSRAELADAFEAPADFVHYIGHCDGEGLRCSDGHLDASELERSRARTFFLNACGSYDQGRALARKGSIAGAITFRTVLDRQAARVGTAFARLLVHGFGFERALGLARRRILMGKDYAVVGDGTYALLPSPKQPAVVRVEEAPEDAFHVTCEVVNARTNGARYRSPFDDGPVLNGRTTEHQLDRETLRANLTAASMPVVYDGDVRWSDEVADEL